MTKQKLFLIFLILLSFFILGCEKEEVKKSINSRVNMKNAKIISEEWLGVYFQENKLGFTHMQVMEGDEHYKVQTEALLKLKLGDFVQDTSLFQECYLDKELSLLNFSYTQTILNHKLEIDGQVLDHQLHLDITSAGATTKKVLDIKENIYPSGALSFIVFKKGLEVGSKYRLNVFLEPLQIVTPFDVEIEKKEEINFQGKTIEAYKIKQSYQSFTTSTWMAEDGEIIKEISMEGLESRREDKEGAVLFDTNQIISIRKFLDYTRLETNIDIDNPSKIKYLKIMLKNLDEVYSVPQDDRQKIVKQTTGGKEQAKGKYEVELDINSLTLNKKESILLPIDAEEFKNYLMPTAQLECTNPKIVKRAKDIIGDEKNAWLAAKKIADWVYKNLDKTMVDTFSALDALAGKEGECQSHSYLYVALCRAVGIPARLVAGIVYAEDFGGFMYHAWAEVYAGKWIAIDPTFGQTKVDATHIKLVEGDWDEQIKLLNVIGKMKIEVVEYK